MAVFATFFKIFVEVSDFKFNIDHVGLFGINSLNKFLAFLIFLRVHSSNFCVEFLVNCHFKGLWNHLSAESTLRIHFGEISEAVLTEGVIAWCINWLNHDGHADRTARIELLSFNFFVFGSLLYEFQVFLLLILLDLCKFDLGGSQVSFCWSNF